MYDPTDTQNELNRKAVEALQLIVKEREAGRATDREASFAMKVLYTAVSGMLRQDLNEILNEQYNAVVAEPVVKRLSCTLKKRTPGEPDKEIKISHIKGTTAVVLEGHGGNRIMKAASPAQALKKFSEMFATLVNRGWSVTKKEVA